MFGRKSYNILGKAFKKVQYPQVFASGSYHQPFQSQLSSHRVSSLPFHLATPTKQYSTQISSPPKPQSLPQPQTANMVSGSLVEMLARNAKFSQNYQTPPPLLEMVKGMRKTGAGVVVLSCSDPRLNPYQVLGLDATLKATMIRNAGGRAFDAIRSMAVLQTIGDPGTIVVMHHTDCGMTHFHDHTIQEALTEIAPEEAELIRGTKFGEITGSIEDSVREDIAIIRASPLIKKTTQIIGLSYDIFTGALTQVPETKSEL